MRYQVRILPPAPKSRRWWRTPRFAYNYGSSTSLQGALILLSTAPFHIGETCIVEDGDSGKWLAVKRGRVASMEGER